MAWRYYTIKYQISDQSQIKPYGHLVEDLLQVYVYYVKLDPVYHVG